MPAFVKTFRFIGVVVALCLCDGAAAAAKPPRYGVFVYSSFCISPMSGDLGGNRITLHRFPDGDTLVYEYTDGRTHALLASELTLDAPFEALRFAVNVQDGSKWKVAGKVSPDGQSLTVHGLPFQGGNYDTLVRVTDFAAHPEACRPPSK
jgi:hypothetical protein